MKDSLSVCIIAKNEENNLERCIRSISNIADEIVVVDTGSTDNTIEVAKKLGANVYFHKWNNSFSEAKNAALDKCNMNWVFVIDADEALEKGHEKYLKELLKNDNIEAFHMRLNNIIGSEIINENPTLRIFRNRKEYRYKSKLHEQIYSSIEDFAGEKAFANTDLILNHYGYDHNVVDMEKKIRRNINILNTYSKEEKDALYYFGLGNEYMKISELEKAKEAFEKAIDMKDEKQGIRPYLAITLSQVCYSLGKNNTALNYISRFLKEFTDFRDLYFLKAVCNNELMKYSKSFIALNMFKSIPIIKEKYPSFKFDYTNDINGLLNILQGLRIFHEKNLLTTVITVNNKDSKYTDVIRSINEISDDVILVNLSRYKEVEEQGYELGATVYNYSGASKEEIENKVFNNAKGKFILYLNENRVVNRNEAISIIKGIDNNQFNIDEFKIIKSKEVK